jgi:hypothetical protein
MLHREVEVREVEGFENQLDEVLPETKLSLGGRGKVPVDFRVQGAFGHQARVFLGLDFHFVLEKVVPDGFHRGEVFDYSAFYWTVRIFGFLGI